MNTELRVLPGLGERDPHTRDVARCVCGSGWFELSGNVLAPNGAVCLDLRGQVIGALGDVSCLSCGRPWQPITAACLVPVRESEPASEGMDQPVDNLDADFAEETLWRCGVLAIHFGVRLGAAPDKDRPKLLAALDVAVQNLLQDRHPGMAAIDSDRARHMAIERARRIGAISGHHTDQTAAGC